jgi:hypothetical protein
MSDFDQELSSTLHRQADTMPGAPLTSTTYVAAPRRSAGAAGWRPEWVSSPPPR